MSLKQTYTLISLLTMLALLLGACGSSASNESIIATSVALTVQAQNTHQAPLLPTPLPVTDLPLLLFSPTPGATDAPPTAPPTGEVKFCTASATFMSETIPDGTIMSPGQVFTKIWHIKNTGTCAWDATWKLVFVSGDLMGAKYVFNFPQPAAPDEVVDVPIVFTAPQTGGSYRGYWEIESPWGLDFGDSGSGNPFWVDIVVAGNVTPQNNKTATVFGVTNVSYDINYRCTSANQFDTVTARITSNGPVTVVYDWQQSDGNNDRNNKITFTAAETKSVSRDWHWGIAASRNPRWMRIVITSPTYQEYSKATMLTVCWP
jgi:hypothetical protein